MAERFQLKALITGVDKLSPTLAGIRKNVAGFQKSIKGSGLADLGIRDIVAGGALAAPFIAGARAAIDLESEMANVRKVVDFDTPEQFAQMGKDIREMSTHMPRAAKDIAAIVAAGGQSGIARDELLGFAQDAVKMGVAFDQTAEQSGDMMAKWRTAFRITQPEVVALADKINYLGNTGPGKANQISAIVSSVGSLGKVGGLASGQIAALGATMLGMSVAEDVAATGVQNFILALTQGSAATKQQQQTFKALRLDSAKVAAGMQKDAQKTFLTVLQAIKDVDKAKQPAVLTQLFGKESIRAIAPLLDNLQLLRDNLGKVGDSSRYTGSMTKEYEARIKTTAAAMEMFTNRVTDLGISLGSVLLPPMNDFMETIGPLVTDIANLSDQYPGVIRGVLGAAGAFAVLRIGALGAAVAMKLFDTVTKMSVIGIVVRVIALAAGALIANWSSVAPFFKSVWESISGYAKIAWGWIKAAFAWHPIGLIISNWQPLGEFFSALWELIKAAVGVGWAYIKDQIGFDPVAVVTSAWQPLVGFFKGLFESIRPYIEPLMSAGAWIGAKAGELGGWAKGAAGQVSGFFAGTNPGNAASGLVGAGTQGVRSLTQSLQAPSLIRPQPSQAQLEGTLRIEHVNAPAGFRPDELKTNQPGLQVSSGVGYRSLSTNR